MINRIYFSLIILFSFIQYGVSCENEIAEKYVSKADVINQSNADSAIILYTQAKEIYFNDKCYDKAISTLLGMAFTCYFSGELEQMEQYLRQALQFNEQYLEE